MLDPLDDIVPTFAALTRAVRDASLPEPVKLKALEVLELMGRDIGTPMYGEQYTHMSLLAQIHPELAAIVAPYMPRLAALLH